MTAPFVYVPEESPTALHNPFYSTPQAAHSPFLPPSPLLYPASPYSPPGTPENFNANSLLWPENAPEYESAYTASWAPISNRQRTTSWHGPAPTLPSSPFLQPAAPAFLHSQSAYLTPGHRRAHSFGAANAPPPPSWLNNPIGNPYAPAAAAQPALQIHPWLNGDAPSPIFHFDLAPLQFAPMRLVNANPPQAAPLGVAEIREPAFHPPQTALRILHPRLPFWPIDLALPSSSPTSPVPPQIPISLGDVLVALHRALHERISHADWETLSEEDRQAVTKAFTKRCRAEAVRSRVPPPHLRDREVAARNDGVKRVDFLLGKTVFKGLVRVPGDPEGCVRMVTA
ncbi:hypothetical protein DFH06DRAFT_1066802 [Mycena polygramma]|nr:hypothetical protein DFH06DRAFT_1066802 [Mycena polygramma]